MDPFDVSEIQPIGEAQKPVEVPRPSDAARLSEPETVNSHMPWAAQLDLGTGIKPFAYAEYTGNQVIDRVSIKIIDPATGSVIREIPNEDVLSFSEALTAYVDMGRRHTGSV